jgi:His/Glu/Gln/Arg/opine family amino acid ABC transporter permease subunit
MNPFEALRAAICATPGIRCDTWYLFADPNIIRFFGEGLRETITLSIASVVLSFVVGLLFALGRLSRRPWIHWPATLYIETIRALPVLLLIVYFGIKGTALFRPIAEPFVGEDFELSRFWAGVLGLSLYTSAVLAEIIRAGIAALPKGQTEAAFALGLDYVKAMRYVILPQALRLMVPAMMGQLTTVIKDTSLVATIGVFELVRQGRVIYTQYFNPLEVFLYIAVIYFVICFALSQASRRLEIRAPVEAKMKMKIEEVRLRDQVA